MNTDELKRLASEFLAHPEKYATITNEIWRAVSELIQQLEAAQRRIEDLQQDVVHARNAAHEARINGPQIGQIVMRGKDHDIALQLIERYVGGFGVVLVVAEP